MAMGNRQVSHSLLQMLGDTVRVVEAGFWQQHRKFLAAIACHHVFAAIETVR